MTSDEYVKSSLALTAWRIAREHGINGMCGALFMIRNRVKAGWQSGNWTSVLEGCGSWHEYPDPRDPEFQKVLQLVDGIYEGTTPDNLTDGAFYCGVYPGRERCAVIGTLSFFK